MIKQILLLFVVALSCTAAFAPLATMPPPTVNVAVQQPQQQIQMGAPSQQLNQGVQSYLLTDEPSSASSTTVTVSLQERKVPTAEEVAAKKRNFNFWFWG